MSKDTIFGVPYRYDLSSPEDELVLHPKVMADLLNSNFSFIVDIIKHTDGSVEIKSGSPNG